MKTELAKTIAARVKSGETIGLGTGTTTELVLAALKARIQDEGLRVRGVPTSLWTARLAQEAGIEIVPAQVSTKIDWGYDGADEVDPQLNLIKGRGAAILGEKIVALRAKRWVIAVTEEKLVPKLGTSFALPVEVVPGAIDLVEQGLARLGAQKIELRMSQGKYGPVITEHGNCLFDVRFPDLDEKLGLEIKSLVGVVEHGLFWGFKPEVLVARRDGVVVL